jgi:cytochrome c oxidase assembly factor CtaG
MFAIPWADPVALAVASAGLVYLRADQRVRAHGPRSRMPRRAFLLGLSVVLLALTGPLDAAVARSFSLHMVQHLALTMVAAPLLVLGAPIRLVLQAWPGSPRRALARVLRSPAVRLLSHPLVGWSLFFLVLWGAHLTGWFEASLRNDGVHALEHAAFLGTALLFWMPVVHADPLARPMPYPARILYLFAAMPAMAFLGLAIVSARDILYPSYAQIEGVARALADQRAAGAIMWAGTMFLLVPSLGVVLLGWMRADEREARRIDAQLELAGERPEEQMDGAR